MSSNIVDYIQNKMRIFLEEASRSVLKLQADVKDNAVNRVKKFISRRVVRILERKFSLF